MKPKIPPAEFAIGGAVNCPLFKGNGRVLDGPNQKSEYLVAVGMLKLWVHAGNLKPAAVSAGKTSRSRKKPKTFSEENPSQSLRLDLHGLNVQDAIRELEHCIDQALLRGVSRIEVIHGIGGGVLKGAVDKYLSASSHISAFRLDERNPGTTWIFM
jgi:DNA mismatch repair protein MutS2